MTEPSRRPSRDRADAPGNESASTKTRPLPSDSHGLVDVARLVVDEVYTTALGPARFEGLGDDGAAAFAELPGAPLMAPERQDRAVVIEGIAARRGAKSHEPERWGWRGYSDAELEAIVAAVPIAIEKVRAARRALDGAGAWYCRRALTHRLGAVARAARQEPPRTDRLLVALSDDLPNAMVMQALAGEVRAVDPGAVLSATIASALGRVSGLDAADAARRAAREQIASWAEAARNRASFVPSVVIRKLEAIASKGEKAEERLDLLARALGFRSLAEAQERVLNGLPDRAVQRALASEVVHPDPEPILLATCEMAIDDKVEDETEATKRKKAAQRKKAAKQLARWAKAAIRSTKSLSKLVAARGRSEDVSLNEWVAAMIGIYRQVTGRQPSTSIGSSGSPHEGEATGPLIRFLAAAGRPLGIELSSDAWRKRVRDVLRATKSPRNKKAMSKARRA